MWQHHYLLHRARMDALLAEADRERRWRLQDDANGRAAASAPGPARATVARAIAWLSRVAAQAARRLDERAAADLVPERLIRDA